MKKIDIVGIAFANFKRRKTRSILTVLGVVIGVASIVIMVSLGIAINVSFEDQIKQWGDLTTIEVYPGYNEETQQQAGKLDDELVAQLEQIPKVKCVSPELSIWGKLVAGKYVASPNIIGVRGDLLDKIGFELGSGTFEGFQDNTGKKYKVIVGPEVPYQFYNPKASNRNGMGGMFMMVGGGGGEEEREPPPVDLTDPNVKLRFTFDHSYGEKPVPGQDLEVKTKPKLYNMEPIAILGGGNMSQKSYSVYIDLEVAKKLKKEQEKQNQNQGGEMGGNSGNKNEFAYDSIKVITNKMEDTIAITQQIKDMGYQAYSSADAINQMKQFVSMIQMLLGGIGSISLIVAAIGITNTMVMSIYERTREIGIMKVIGCQLKDIGTMFLCEAAFIGLFGGAVGLLISYGASALLNMVAKSPSLAQMGMGLSKLSVIPPWLALVAVVFAIMVGLVAGFLPARRAMKLSALEAMRN